MPSNRDRAKRQRIILQRYGAGDSICKIGAMLNITAQRVWQILHHEIHPADKRGAEHMRSMAKTIHKSERRTKRCQRCGKLFIDPSRDLQKGRVYCGPKCRDWRKNAYRKSG